MIAEIQKDGYIHIIAETTVEAYAIKYLIEREEKHMPVVIETAILFDTDE